MMNKILSIFFLAATLLATSSTAFAQISSGDRASEVRQLLEERDREIKRLLGGEATVSDEQRERLKSVINRGIDFEAMGRLALGPFWSDLTPEQRTDFVDVFGEIVRNQSLSNLDVYRSNVTYKDVTVEGDTARAITETTYKGVPTKVEYRLGLTSGGWHVHDIILDDVSTVEGYARSFQTVVRKRGFDSLMDSLRKKLDGMSQ